MISNHRIINNGQTEENSENSYGFWTSRSAQTKDENNSK